MTVGRPCPSLSITTGGAVAAARIGYENIRNAMTIPTVMINLLSIVLVPLEGEFYRDTVSIKLA
jgi:hypothetical protein